MIIIILVSNNLSALSLTANVRQDADKLGVGFCWFMDQQRTPEKALKT